MDLIEKWRVVVSDIENKYYFEDDEFDLDNDLAVRDEITKEHLSSSRVLIVTDLDERFKAALWPMLRQANLADFYLRIGAGVPENKWWWHVKEQSGA